MKNLNKDRVIIKPKMATQCKLCKLVHTHPELWTEIHSKVLKEGYSRASVCTWVNSKLELLNANAKSEDHKLTKFTEQNFSRHFNKHNTFELQQALHRNSVLYQNRRLEAQEGFSDEEVAVAQNFADDFAGYELNEYSSLVRMVATLEQRLWAYDKFIKKKDEDRPHRGVDLDEIGGYQKQIESLMKLKIDLSKLRNSSVIAGAAIETAVETTVASFLEIMMEVTEEAQTILQTELPGSSIPLEVSKLIRNRMADHMKSIVPGLVEQVSKDYKIR